MNEADRIFGAGLSAGELKEEAPSAPEGAAPAVPDQLEGLKEQTTPMTELANFVMSRFRENWEFRSRSGVTERLNGYLRAMTCTFSEDQERRLVEGGLPPHVVKQMFVPITATKTRAAKAMLTDLVNQSGDPPFRIEPTPSPEVPEEVSEAAVEKVGAEITALFSQLAQSGVQQLPPDAEAKLNQLVVSATNDAVDAASSAEEQFAKNRAARMETKVWDMMVEGGWEDAFLSFVDNVCIYGTGVMVGPVSRVVAANTCVSSKGSDGRSIGVKKYRRVLKSIPTYESVNPMDCYPAPDAQDVDDGPLCITVKYTADELWRFADSSGRKDPSKGGDGWNPSAVKDVIVRHPRGGVKLVIVQFDYERRMCERNGTEDTNDCTFEGVRCFASVRGSVLAGMGIFRNRDGRRIDLNAFYRTETIVVDNRVVYCRIYDDAMGFPVSRGRFYSLPGSWWGEAIADKVAMCQCVLNNVIRAVLMNMASSSGAIYYINDVQRLANKSPDALKFRSGMTIPFTSSMTSSNSGAPVGAITVPSVASELLAVWTKIQTQADLDSGVPAYTEGQPTGGGAMRTASGLATYTEASTRTMKMVMTRMDRDVIAPVVRRTADWVLLYDDDMSLKGDVEVRPVGLIGKILKAQRDNQRLQLFNIVVGNQFLLQVVGAKGVMALMRPTLRDIDVNADDVIPSEERLNQMELIQGIKQIFEATSASQGVQQNVAAAQSNGAPPGTGVEQPQSGVAERRSVA